MADQSYMGLGYGHNSPSHQPLHNGNNMSNGLGGNGVEDLMQSYMQQCVEYHEHELEDQQWKEQQQETTITATTVETLATDINTPVNFIPARDKASSRWDVRPELDPMEEIQKKLLSENPEFTKAMERARAIAKRLADGTSALKLPDGTSVAPIAQPSASMQSSSSSLPAYIVPIIIHPYAQKRQEFNIQHAQKLHTHLISNFDYLAQKDEEQLQLQLDQMHNANSRASAIQIQQKVKTKNINIRGVTSVAGIGSKERQKVQKIMENKGCLSSSLPPCGIYITGLLQQKQQQRKNQNQKHRNSNGMQMQMQMQNKDELEKTLMELFSSYGKVSKVKLYTNRKTNRPKGDGLIIYDWGAVRKMRIGKGESDDVGDFQGLVCGQLNGVELPCGSIVKAEPMTTEYDSNSNSNSAVGNNMSAAKLMKQEITGLKGDVHHVGIAETKEAEGGEEEDLDDFFASLE